VRSGLLSQEHKTISTVQVLPQRIVSAGLARGKH